MEVYTEIFIMRQYVWNLLQNNQGGNYSPIKKINNRGKGKWDRKAKGNKIGQELVIAVSAKTYIGGLYTTLLLPMFGIFINKNLKIKNYTKLFR